MFGDSNAREAGEGVTDRWCANSVTDLHSKVALWAAQSLHTCWKWPGWKGLRNSVWPGLGWEKPATNKNLHRSSVAKLIPEDNPWDDSRGVTARDELFINTWVIQGWHYLCHFLSTFCSHHHSAVMPSTVPLTFPEEGDDCKNQDSQEDARDEGQWHEQYFMAVDTQKIPSEFPVMTEGLKHQNSPNFMGCNTFIPSPMRSTGVYLHRASLGITHPVHRLGNSNQILNSQGVKYVIYNPSLAERRCSLRKLWVWSQEIKVQHLLINPASDFCSSEIICRGVGSGVDGGRDSGSSENGFWCNCNRKKKSQTCFKMCKFLQ